MAAARFRGGVHPRDHKETAARAVRELPPASLYRVCLSQHIGAPSRPLVAAGDRVVRGQPLAEAAGFVSVPQHSPVCGWVKALEPSPHPSGRLVPAVVIEADGEEDEMRLPADPSLEQGPSVWRTMVREAGIVGLGGAAFPTHVKLSPPEEKPLDTLIANGVECEPYLTADHRLMLEESGRIARGLALAMEMAGVERAVLAVEANKPDAAEALRAASLPAGARVQVLPVRYPQGAEKQLIHSLLGRCVPSGGLPMDVGVVVQNVATLAAIGDAVYEGIPLTRRVLTLGGTLPRGAGNYRVPVGTPLSHVVEASGGLQGPPSRILSGGPMMGVALRGLEGAVMKGTSGLLLFGPGELPLPRNRVCLRCGACVRVCPMGLMPHELGNLVQYRQFHRLQGANILDCIECGCCAYQCPAERQLVQFIRQGKGEVMALRGKTS